MAPKLRPGDKIWQYQIDDFLGEGAFAATYLAHHQTMRKRRVAIKQLKRSRHIDSNNIKRFIREAYAMGELCHPNIVMVHELIDPEHYPNETDYSIVMEYMDGGTLEEWMEREDRPLASLPNAVRVVQSVLEGLAAAHSEKIYHRDIKPANILLSADGSQVKLGDWGLAHFDTFRSTALGVRMGTPSFMAPEQAAGESYNVDGRCDLYAVGAVLYEIVTGHPYLNLEEIFNAAVMRCLDNPQAQGLDQRMAESMGVEAMYSAIQYQPPEDPRKHVPDLPLQLCRILNKALAKKREERYQTANEFITALKSINLGKAEKQPTAVMVDEKSRQIAPLLVRARQQRIENNYTTAVSILREAQEISPAHPGVCLELAHIYNQMEQYEDAERILTLAQRHDPDNYVILRDLGFTFARLRKNKQALDALEKALALNHNQSDVERKVNSLKRILKN